MNVFNSNGAGDGGSTPGSVQGQTGQGSEQTDLVKNVPDYCTGVRLGYL